MELRHLKYFVTVAEESNITRAASRLFVTQPALSRQIKDLERELDVELLLRTPSGLQLTPAGASFLPQAREVLEKSTQAALSMRAFAECRKRSLAIGYIAPALGSFLSSALQTFNQRHPQIEVRLFELSPAAQMEALSEGRLDIALIGHVCPALHREYKIIAIHSIPLEAVLPKTHALAARKKIKLLEIKDEPFIGLSPQAFPERNEIIREACQKAGFTPRFAHEADGLQSVLALVGSGLGVCLMPDEVAQLPHPNVAFVPLQPKTNVEFCAALALNGKRPSVLAIVEEFRAAIS